MRLKRATVKDLKEHLMHHTEMRDEYERIDEKYSLIQASIRARSEAKLTQAALVESLDTTQYSVAGLKGGRIH